MLEEKIFNFVNFRRFVESHGMNVDLLLENSFGFDVNRISCVF